MYMEGLFRTVTTHNTETVLLLICLLFLAIARTFHTNKFRYFSGILFSGKYLKIYGRGQAIYYNWFHFFLFGIQLISLGLFAKTVAVYFNLNIVPNVLIITLSVAVFVLSKFLIEKIISVLFSIEMLIRDYNFYKLNYWNFMGVILLPFNALLIYNPINKTVLIYATMILFGVLSLTAMVLILKNNQKIIFDKPFYFILYLCTLEIAPYLIVAKSLIIT